MIGKLYSGLYLLLVLLLSGGLLYSQHTYTVEKELRTKIRKETWQKLKVETPKENRLSLGLLFLSNGIFNDYIGVAAKYGYQPNDMLTATTFYFVISNEIITSKNYSEKEIATLYEKTKATIRDSKTFADLSSDQIQKISDPLILETLWLYNLIRLRKSDNAPVKRLAEEKLNAYYTSSTPFAEKEEKKPEIEENKSIPPPVISNNAPGNIQEIIMRTRTSYGLNGVYTANDVCVLYKNGDMYINPIKPLESFNIIDSKNEHPGNWNSWRKRNDAIYVTFSKNGKVGEWKRWFDLRPVKKGFTIKGKFSTIDPFGGAVVINASTVYFDEQGKFVWDNVKGGSNDMSSVYIKSNYKGTYGISGHTIELNYTSGTKESYFFSIYPKSKKHFIIGKSHFVPEEG